MTKDMTRRHSVDIRTDGVLGQVIVDGVDLSNAVHAITWRAAVGEIPAMELDLNIIDVTTVTSKDTEILIPDATREALIALGWTPPGVTASDNGASETKPQVRGPLGGKDAGRRGGG